MSSFAPDLGNPLKVGKSITITGPSIYRDITPPSNYLSPAPDSWLPIRPIHRELVGPKGIAEASGTEWHLRVTKVRRIHSQGRYNISFGYISKKGRPKEGRPKEEYRVALKVSHQNLPGLAQSYKDQLDDTGDLVRFAPEIEAAYYNTYRQLQGRELQICYGMFSVMLEGALVWLTVVEDIYTSGQTSDISSWAERFRERGEPVVMTEVFGGAKYELTRGLVLARSKAETQTLRRFLSCNNEYLPNCTSRRAFANSNADSLSIILGGFYSARRLDETKATLLSLYHERLAIPVFGLERRFSEDADGNISTLLRLAAMAHQDDDVVSLWSAINLLEHELGLEYDSSLPI